MRQRIIAVFCVITVLMTTVIYRIYYINASDYLTTAAAVQGKYRVDIATSRGGIYDRNMKPLVNTGSSWVAAVLPTPQAATALLEVETEENRPALLERLSGVKPFAMRVENQNIYAQGVDVFQVPVRYSEGIAPHLIGYLGGDGMGGVAGIEKACNQLLVDEGSRVWATYEVDAAGQALHGTGADIHRVNEEGKGGVVLSLDKDIQLIAQNALSSGWDKGAVVVMDVATGDILAMASIPAFDPNDIASSLEREDAPFINRAISGYNIGSVFKVVVAAAALENNISPYHQYECEGYVDIGGQVFRCNNHAVHGTLDMERALEVSCNTYFIHLAREVGPEYILALCEHMGLGSAAQLAPGLYTQPGNLPGAAELANPAGLANFGFGQGSSLATPLQMAQVVSAIAGGGKAVTPRLVRGVTLDGATLSEQTPIYTANQLISPGTAATVRDMMVAVVSEGSGKQAASLKGGAGGKTSSAQTGQMAEDKEIVHAWFAGFYPAEQPRYSIVVFCEGGESGENVAAPIFKQIADGIAGLEYR